MSAYVSSDTILSGKIRSYGSLKGCIRRSANLIGHVCAATGYSVYNGDCEVTPDTDTVTLSTANKVVPRDITVNPIPTYTVTNDSGGETFIIGGPNEWA